ncbi:Metallo-peptidase family M12-domain-containing protein [Apodospora peruviana]|uniref:Disintegrin and metalloproteinase domain-containing protein B n=1 Tax=Apodospora peruviana TaxID=516989 RepID=A0AAE0M192_9PEZI|nr:Metallo-peptidase family M12-domain-containing protein [Apodospora peruviana]
MILSRAFAAVLAGVGVLIQSTIAHSTHRSPLSYVTRIDDANIQTPSHRIHAHSSFEISFLLHDRKQRIRLVLEPNHDILSQDATIQHMDADGNVHRIEPINRADHKIFKGRAFIRLDGQSEWTNAGWARINVHRDGQRPVFEGAFSVNADNHHIQTSASYRQTAIEGDPEIEWAQDEYMVVWRDSDITASGYGHDDLKRDSHAGHGCTADDLVYNRAENNIVYRAMQEAAEERRWASMSPANIFGRQLDGTQGGAGAGVNLASTIGSTQGCPTTRKVALVGIATDCNYASQFPSNTSLRANVIQQVNTASQLFESTFNISLGIQNLTVTDAKCPSTAPASAPWNVACSSGKTITDRLNLFSAWRGLSKDGNAYWTLLTTCNTGAAVGLAWLGQVCIEGATASGDENIAGANVVVRTSTEWQVFAHETGHTFGAVHDCISQTCSDGSVTKQECCPLSSGSCNANSEFIMNPSTAQGIEKFSACSIGNVCSFLGRSSTRMQCLANNKDVTTITGSQCGNGIVESGEDCDCGGPSGCSDNPCCDAATCKFTANSVCDPSNEECCSQQCQFRSKGTVCRPSTGSCDPEETCPGDSPNCPADASSPDGTECGGSGSKLTCASGQCTSRDLQCKTLMGSLTAGNDTYSCSSQGCILSCASPEFGANVCYKMQQYFLDGTECEGGGKCNNGNCQGATLGNQIGSWITDNKNIVIPVAAVVGGLILLAFVSCIWNCFRRRRSRRAKPVSPPPRPRGWNSYGGPGIPVMGGGNSSVSPTAMRQPPGVRHQPMPYPGAGVDQRYEPVRSTRQNSFRYA